MKTFTSRLKVRIILLSLLFLGFNINAQTFEISDSTTSSIELSFSTTSDGVLILYSDDGSFTDPSDGVAYSQGNTIGSNEVIYVGNTSPTSHSSLTANTLYYYRAWEYDAANNYTLVDSDDAYTLKYEPTYHATNFSANTNSDVQITLTWTDGIGFVRPDGYLVKASTVSYADITSPTDGVAEADALLTKNIDQGLQTAVFNGLDGNKQYYFKIFPYTNSGTDINYKTSISNLPTTTATTDKSSSSDIVEKTGFSYSQNIDYISEVGADVTSANTTLWGLTIRDGGGSADADNETTTLDNLTISITNSSFLQKIAIYDGTTEIQEVAAAASVNFTSLGLQAADDGEKDFQIKATYNTSITDNDIISFSIESANLSSDVAGSDFGTFATLSSSTVSPNNQMEVDADQLSIIQQPTIVYSNYAIDPAVTIEAVDANGNRDLDYTPNVTTSVNAGVVTLSGTNTATPINGLATFNDIQFSDDDNGVTLDFNASGTSSVTSNSFDVLISNPEIQISEGATVLDAADGVTDFDFGDIEWGTTSSAISLTIENIGKAELTITTPVSNNGDFAVSTQPSSSLIAGSSTIIGIEFTPTSQGSITGKITISNNDSDEGSFVINLEGNGTLNENSSVSASSFDPADDINYLNYQAIDLSSSLTGAIKIAEFTLTDGADDDNASTILTDIEIGISNHANLNRIAIYDGSSILDEDAAAASVNFTGLNIEATDENNTTFEIYASFKTNVTDNEQIQLTINSVTADANGSGFASPNGGAATSPIVGDDNRIDVSASKLVINSVDNPVDVSANFNLSLQALDVNDNLDLDQTSSVTLALNSGSGNLSSATSLTQSLSSGEYSWTDVQYDTEQTFEIEAQSTGLANDLSGNINVNASSSSIAETPISGQISSQTISSLNDTDAEAIDIFSFNITDDGDGNGVNTDVTNIRIKAAAGNNINWSNHIQGVIINAGGVISSTPTISSNQIDLSIASGNLLIADGASTEVTISVYLNTSNITDNGQLQMLIDSDNHGFTADGTGSGFASTFNGDVSSNIHTIEVVASELSIITQPTDVYTDYSINPDVTVEAVDANGNRDLDYVEDIDVVVNGTPINPAFAGSATTTVTAISGLATFDNIIFSSNSSNLDINLLFSSTGSPAVSSILSVGFEVIESLPEINIKQVSTTYLSGSSYDFATTEVGASTEVDFVIENLGQKALNISSSSVSGAAFSFIVSPPASIAANSSATITVSFDPASVGGLSGTLSIDHDDATGSEDPYQITLAGDGIPNNNSSIIESTTFTYNENIDYSLYQSTNITSDGTGTGNIQIGEFTIQDGPDADGQTTTLTAISFNISNSSNLNRIAIVNGSSVVDEEPASSSVSFSGLSLLAADELTKSFKVYASFNSSVNDNDQIQLTISSATVAAGSSGFASADAGGVSSSIVGDDNKIVVSANEIVFSTYPSSVDLATNFTIAVEAVDANGNRDLDEASDVTLSKGSGSGSLTNVGPTAFSSGYVEFTTVQYDNEDDFSVDATADAPLSKSVVGALITTNRAEQLFAEDPATQILANSISSVNNDEATESLSVFKFDITDDGTGVGDNSVLSNIRIIPAASNTANWANAIQGLKLNDGSPISIGSPTITSSYIDIPLTGGYTVNDGSTKEITMDIYLNQTNLLIDGEVISFMIDADNHGWTDDGSGSALKTDFGSDVVSNDFTIDIQASELNFVSVPSPITIGNQFTVEVEAIDVHGNIDTDESSLVTIAKNTGAGDLFTSDFDINLSSGVASWTDLEYNVVGDFKIEISGSYTTIISGFITADDIAAPNSPVVSIDYLADDQIQIDITKPSGSFGSDWDGYVVFAREATSNDAVVSSTDFGDFTANSVYGSSVLNNNSYCVAKVSSNNDLSSIITGLTRNSDYYFVAYAVKEINGAGNDKWSAASTEVFETADLQGVSSFAANAGDAQVNLSWTNYTGPQPLWWDEVMVVAKPNSAVTYSPSGDGTAYTANPTYTSGTDLGSGQYVVYKGTSNSVSVDGLNNGETYYFRAFVRRGTVWTDADQFQSASATPSGGSANVIISEVADYLNDASKSYVEIYNGGSSSININGWQLNQYSPNASVTFNSATQKNSAADLVLNPGEYALIVNSDWSGLKSDFGISNNVAIFVGSSVPTLSGGQYYDLNDGSAKATVDEFGSSTTFSTSDEYAYERNTIPNSDGTLEESWSNVPNTSYGYTPAGENNNPLPVELIDFYAEKDGNRTIINWITASELNNDYFTLYKSLDANNFSPISTIPGQGNSISLNYYSEVDEENISGVVYYKLKQIDFDGTATFSNTISIYNEDQSNLEIQKAYFNSGNLNLLIKHNSYEILEINIYSIEGKLIEHINHKSNANLNALKIDLSRSNSSQVYIIEVKDSRNREVIKIVK